jgi:hypothetical protein
MERWYCCRAGRIGTFAFGCSIVRTVAQNAGEAAAEPLEHAMSAVVAGLATTR